MKSKYYEYLKGLDKQSLIKLLYTPVRKGKEVPYKSYRTVALRMSYDGRYFKGVQNHRMVRSIGGELENVLALTGIGESPTFCGRTDAGVSAINMIVSLKVKSIHENPNRSFVLREDDHNEYPYDAILNERLPEGIEITGWAPAPDSFNARFSCKQRHYKYFFVRNGMDLDRMREAACRILGMTNFYLLSKHSNPRARYDRSLDELVITRVDEPMPGKIKYKSINQEENGIYDGEGVLHTYKACRNEGIENELYCIDIKAHSFLHNMIRKIVWVLKRYARGNEFDLDFVGIADAYPLVFMGATFEQPLSFLGNHHCAIKFSREENETRIIHAVVQLRLKKYSDEDVFEVKKKNK